MITGEVMLVSVGATAASSMTPGAIGVAAIEGAIGATSMGGLATGVAVSVLVPVLVTAGVVAKTGIGLYALGAEENIEPVGITGKDLDPFDI